MIMIGEKKYSFKHMNIFQYICIYVHIYNLCQPHIKQNHMDWAPGYGKLSVIVFLVQTYVTIVKLTFERLYNMILLHVPLFVFRRVTL